jgi:hypothetical protein
MSNGVRAPGLRPVQVVSTLSGIGGALDLRTIQEGPVTLGHVSLAQEEANVAYVKLFDALSPGEVFDNASLTFTRQPVQTLIIPGNAAGAGSNIQIGGAVLAVGGLAFDNGLVIGFSSTKVTAGASGLTVNQQVVANFGVK